MTKTILILLDGAGYQATRRRAGFLEALCQRNDAQIWQMQAALPSISAPLYETIMSGVSPLDHGITGNHNLRPSQVENVFASLHHQGKISAAVAHSYFYSLYMGGKSYDPIEDCEVNDPAAPIAYGRYYSMESYCKANICAPAEIDLCAQADYLIRQHHPEFLLLHSSSPDSVGHAYGGNSSEYLKQIGRIDDALGRVIPRWLAKDYHIFVTADHGMSEDGDHGGTESQMRDIPFYSIGTHKFTRDERDILDQLAIAPTLLKMMGLPIPSSMKTVPLD